MASPSAATTFQTLATISARTSLMCPPYLSVAACPSQPGRLRSIIAVAAPSGAQSANQ
jgi:hypothetical protein